MAKRPPVKRKPNELRWLLEPLEGAAGFIEKPMFGCLACYLHGRLMLVLADGDEPWRGVLLPTEREHHSALMERFTGLVSHPVLGKWLYLSMADEEFETTAQSLVEAVLDADPMIGVIPSAKTKRRPKNEQ